ncbi:acetyl-coenzyme A synthetase N-terminal domain-containing protein, partial [Streptomyces sp. NPDC088251]|uniref:acetyl-coenzyme A synthetase N-terminal domain-containing protein n=1 Tax=Streptomyces sp. NPDC088251 TaxID=3365844 RepID=UPI00381D455D
MRHQSFSDYAELWRWSTTELPAFWSAVWEFYGLDAVSSYDEVLADASMLGATWFGGARMNLAEQCFARTPRDHLVHRSVGVLRPERGHRHNRCPAHPARQRKPWSHPQLRSPTNPGGSLVAAVLAGQMDLRSGRTTCYRWPRGSRAREQGSARHEAAVGQEDVPGDVARLVRTQELD